jgi:predicted phosphodiesterase
VSIISILPHISDIHIRAIDKIPAAIGKAPIDVALVVRAGDFTHKVTLDSLQAIGFIHGSGAPWEIAERMRKKFYYILLQVVHVM